MELERTEGSGRIRTALVMLAVRMGRLANLAWYLHSTSHEQLVIPREVMKWARTSATWPVRENEDTKEGE